MLVCEWIKVNNARGESPGFFGRFLVEHGSEWVCSEQGPMGHSGRGVLLDGDPGSRATRSAR